MVSLPFQRGGKGYAGVKFRRQGLKGPVVNTVALFV